MATAMLKSGCEGGWECVRERGRECVRERGRECVREVERMDEVGVVCGGDGGRGERGEG